MPHNPNEHDRDDASANAGFWIVLGAAFLALIVIGAVLAP